MLTQEQLKIHARALEISSGYLKREFELLAVLGEVDRTKLFKKLDCPSLFRYAVDLLGLSEAMAYALISIARKNRELPGLVDGKLSISKLSRIVSVVNAENKDELVSFAKKHTAREIDREVARRNPAAASRDRIRRLSAELTELKMSVPQQFLEKLDRAKNLEAHKNLVGFVPVLEAALDILLFHKDPVRRAERAQKKNGKRQNSVRTESSGRVPLTAAEKHAVFLRDGGKCTHVGGNDPANLTTLCSFHHDLAHPTWLRAPILRYG